MESLYKSSSSSKLFSSEKFFRLNQNFKLNSGLLKNDSIPSRMKNSFLKQEQLKKTNLGQIRKFDELMSPCFSLTKQLSPSKRLQQEKISLNKHKYSNMIDRLIAVNTRSIYQSMVNSAASRKPNPGHGNSLRFNEGKTGSISRFVSGEDKGTPTFNKKRSSLDYKSKFVLNRVGESSKQPKSGCQCKKSACVKKYCPCYSAGGVCGPSCQCQGCKNRGSSEIQKSRNMLKLDYKGRKRVNSKSGKSSPYSRAYLKDRIYSETLTKKNGSLKRLKGLKKISKKLNFKSKTQCNCKNSRCVKMYCECFKNGAKCGDNCSCIDCYNMDEHIIQDRGGEEGLQKYQDLMSKTLSTTRFLQNVMKLDSRNKRIALGKRHARARGCSMTYAIEE